MNELQQELSAKLTNQFGISASTAELNELIHIVQNHYSEWICPKCGIRQEPIHKEKTPF